MSGSLLDAGCQVFGSKGTFVACHPARRTANSPTAQAPSSSAGIAAKSVVGGRFCLAMRVLTGLYAILDDYRDCPSRPTYVFSLFVNVSIWVWPPFSILFNFSSSKLNCLAGTDAPDMKPATSVSSSLVCRNSNDTRRSLRTILVMP